MLQTPTVSLSRKILCAGQRYCITSTGNDVCSLAVEESRGAEGLDNFIGVVCVRDLCCSFHLVFFPAVLNFFQPSFAQTFE